MEILKGLEIEWSDFEKLTPLQVTGLLLMREDV
jgi:hypothetical protein